MAQSTPYKSDQRTTSSNLADQAAEQVGRVADSIEGAATRVREQGREASHQVREVASNFQGALERSIEKQPMATLAVAAAVGFVLGAIWKS